MSTRVVLLRDGVITQIATPLALYQAPASEFAANFIGDANLLEGHVVESGGRLAVAWCGLVLEGLAADGRAAGETVRLMVRPEAIRLIEPHAGTDATCADGLLERSSFYGFYWIHRVRVGGETLVVREMGATPPPSSGAPVRVAIDAARAVILP